MPYILSPEQKVVLNALVRDETSSTKYFDIVTALQTICKSCTSVLNDGKKVLIHVPNSEAKRLLESMFQTNGLEDLTIDISSNQPMPEVDIIKLRSTVKKQKDTDAIIKYVLSNKKTATKRAKLDQFYNAFDTKVMADKRFRDFTTNSIYHKISGDSTLSINSKIESQLQFSATEFYKLKKEISRAAQIYNRQYDLFDHLSLFKTELWNGITEKRILEIKTQIDNFRAESSNLDRDFVLVNNELTKNSSKELLSKFEVLENKFQIHEEACLAYQIKSEGDKESNEGVFSIFKKKKPKATNKIYIDAFDELSSLIQNISQQWYNELDAPTSEMITYQYIMEFINKNENRVTEFKTKISKTLQTSVQRINKINTSSNAVIALDKRLEALIKKMSESEIFDIDIKHTILSFIKQAELCKNISDYIEKCHILLHSSATYMEWKSFYNSSSENFSGIFDSIKNLPKNLWVESFGNWYEQQLQNHVLNDNFISSSVMNDYYTQASITNQAEVAAIIAQLHPTRIEGAETLKETTKELHNTLYKKKQLPTISWNNTALMNRTFMKAFFPIHISETLAHASEYDLVVSFSRSEEKEEAAIHFFSPIESKDIQNMAEKKDNFLYLNDYNYQHPLGQLSSTDKLKASKKLAKFILSLNQNIKIYQLKNANIISLLPSYDDSKLESELDKLNVKVIDTNEVLYNRLTESILFTDRKPYLIIKDELINCDLHEHLLWQLKLIQLFNDVGYEIISLNTMEQLEDNQGQFDKIVQKIGGLTTKPKEVKVQDTETQTSIAEEA